MLPTIHTLCQPRTDVRSGASCYEQFMADLSQVVNGTAPPGGKPRAWLVARLSPPRDTLDRGVWVPGGREEPFAPTARARRLEVSPPPHPEADWPLGVKTGGEFPKLPAENFRPQTP